MPTLRQRLRLPAIVALVIALLIGGFFLRYQMPHVQLPAERVFTVAGFPITNSMIATWLAMLALWGFFRAAAGRVQLVPPRLQSLAETIVEALLGLCTSVAGHKNGRRFFALVASLFLFVLFNNWIGLLPGFSTIGIWGVNAEGERAFVPLLRSASSDLNTTVALALVSVIATQIYGVKVVGLGRYLSRFFNLRGGPIGLFVGLLELISEFAKIISFSFRLFGNIFAGEVLLTVVSYLLPLVVIIPFLGLELFVGAIQAFVFAMLTLIFLTIATTGHEEAHEKETSDRSIQSGESGTNMVLAEGGTRQ